jgi:hypothetical protein
MGAPINALAAGQRQQPAVVGNAMAAPVAAASPYGAVVQPPAAQQPGVVGSSVFAGRAKDQELVNRLKQEAASQRQKESVGLEISLPAAKSAVDASVGDIDAQIARVKSLREHKGLGAITGGIMGRLPSAREDATSAQADLNQIISKAGFEALQQMRNSSPTGGALGNVSDTEGKRLEASAAALAQSQGKADFQTKLDRYIADLERSRKSVKSAFDSQYAGVKSNAAPSMGAPAENTGPSVDDLLKKYAK